MEVSINLNKKAEQLLLATDELEEVKERVQAPERVASDPRFDHRLLKYWRRCIIEEGYAGLATQKPEAGLQVNKKILKEDGVLSSEETAHLYTLWAKGQAKVKIKKISPEQLNDQKWLEDKGVPPTIPVIVAPMIFTQKGESDLLTPLWVCAALGTDRKLSAPDEDAPAPWIPREYLAPNERSSLVLGSAEKLESFLASRSVPVDGSWKEIMEFCRQMWEHTFLEGWQQGAAENGCFMDPKHAFILPKEVSSNASANILKTYNTIFQDKTFDGKIKLLTRLSSTGESDKNKVKPCEEWPLASKDHVGHATTQFSLSMSQREAMVHFLDMKQSEILAVNGPPGTGKTTLLQGIVATMSVLAALEDKAPPVILGSSALNQAVTNIIDAFTEISSVQRWVPEVEHDNGLRPVNYGLYLVSETQKNKDSQAVAKKYQWVTRQEDDFTRRIENPEYVRRAKAHFLEQASRYFGAEITNIENAKNLLLRRLKEKQLCLAEGVDALLELYQSLNPGDKIASQGGLDSFGKEMEGLCRQGETLFEAIHVLKNKTWLGHSSREPVWLALLGWLPPIKKRRQDRNELFWHQASEDLRQAAAQSSFDCEVEELVPHGFNREDVSDYLNLLFSSASKNKRTLDQAQAKVNSKKRQIAKGQRHWQDWAKKNAPQQSAWTKEVGLSDVEAMLFGFEDKQGETNPDNFFNWLDVCLRAEMFELATHYWEARWLLEVENGVEAPVPGDLEGAKKQWQRQAMLTPVFVTTLQSGPGFFSWERAKRYRQPMFDFADMLIIDEGGQVAPPLAGGMFALAQKALVVGDVVQIEPVVSLSETIDRANLKKMELAESEDDYRRLEEQGVSISKGTLMQVAQNAGAYLPKQDGFPRGMFLQEHRRCQPAIIDYCNKLAYHGALVPKRSAVETPWPPMGYANFKGRSTTSYDGSRKNEMEAQVIAQWIADNQEQIADHYGKPVEELHKLVGVVTPFKAQKRALVQALKEKGVGGKDELRVGTVHVFQGAECPLILFSPVYTTEDQVSYFFDKGVNMLNVAVSRAKDAFLVFGDAEIFANQSEDKPSGLLAHYLFSDPRNELCGIDYVPEVVMKESCTTLEAHQDVLREAFLQARKKLTIVSAYIRERAVQHDRIDDMVRKAVGRGVEVQIYIDRDSNSDSQGRFSESAQKAIDALETAGAQVVAVHRTHRKHLCVDDQIYTNGSFNWLSAERELSQYMKDEKTDVVTGEEAQKRIVEVQAMMDGLPKAESLRDAV